jgi:2-(1,2-epoxy-1,2-dihydrophenyl)acetyl-CoA isomerase
MIWQVIDDEQLKDEALSLAKRLATQPTKGLALIKRAIQSSWDNSFDEQLDLERDLQTLAGRTEDYREGVKAFMEKRQPDFKGK